MNDYNVNPAVLATIAAAIHKEMVRDEEEVRPVDPSRSAWLEQVAWEEGIWTLEGWGRWDHALPSTFRGRHLPNRRRRDPVAFDEAAG